MSELNGADVKVKGETSNGDLATHHQPPPAKRHRWAPTLVRDEPPRAPPLEHKLEEEAAAQAAAHAAGYEGRRQRRFMQRRTVDFNSSHRLWGLHRALKTTVRDDRCVRPSVHHIVELLPPAAYASSSQAVTTNLVHTSTNKIRNPVNIVTWQPDGRRLLTGSQSGEFTLWNSLTFNFETILQAHDHPIRAIQYSRSGGWIISCDQGGTIKYFQANMNNLQAFAGHREAVRGLSFSPDDSRFISASDDGTMKIWGFEEAREEKVLKGHGWDVKCVQWHPFKGLIVSGSKDNLIKFWDPRTGGVLATSHGHKNTVQAVKWSKDGNLVASASRDQVVKIYDIRAMNEVYTLKGHPKEVCSVDWHPDHKDLLVSGGSDGSMLFWSLNAAEPEKPVHSILEAHESNIWSMSWHPLGQVLASGSNDHTSRFWQRARPEDGRREEGAGGEEASKMRIERMKRAAKGAEDWDDDFIPGLTSRRPPLPSRGDAPAPLGMGGGPGMNGGPSGGYPPGPPPSGMGMYDSAPIPGLGGGGGGGGGLNGGFPGPPPQGMMGGRAPPPGGMPGMGTGMGTGMGGMGQQQQAHYGNGAPGGGGGPPAPFVTGTNGSGTPGMGWGNRGGAPAVPNGQQQMGMGQGFPQQQGGQQGGGFNNGGRRW